MSTTFQLVSVTTVLRQRWRTLLLFTVLTAVAAAVTVFLMPRSYRSKTLIAAANPQLADKARLFNTHIQQLYSYFGSGDDLDRLSAIADLDTLHAILVKEFHLADYYKVKTPSSAEGEFAARKCLQKDLHFERTEKGQLLISIWTKDPQLSAAIVNRLVALIQQTATQIWQHSYEEQYLQLDTAVQNAGRRYQLLKDSLAKSTGSKTAVIDVELQSLATQLQQYQSTRDEFAIAAKTTAPALYVLEAAVPAAKAERPDEIFVILSAALAGFFFGICVILASHREPAISTE